MLIIVLIIVLYIIDVTGTYGLVQHDDLRKALCAAGAFKQQVITVIILPKCTLSLKPRTYCTHHKHLGTQILQHSQQNSFKL